MDIPIPTLHLFQELDAALIRLLRSLSEEDWRRPTLARLWTVKDIATHLLDGNYRTVSMIRDGYFGDKPEDIHSYQDLVAYLNGLNADWVRATKRLSPRVLTDLLEVSGREYYQCLLQLNPFEPALFSVAWAGEEESFNWFHIAREYTEKWHHQQQIREAVGQPGISNPPLFRPVLQTFLRALPHAYRNTNAVVGTVVVVHITGDSGGNWAIERQPERWIFSSRMDQPTASVSIDQSDAWKLLTKALSPADLEGKVRITGNTELAQPALAMVSIMG